MIVGRTLLSGMIYFIITYNYLFRERGQKGEAVLQIYSDYLCARQWGSWLKEVPNTMERRLQMALNDTFGDIDVPEAYDSVFKFWEEGSW